MGVKLLTEHNFEFLRLKGGCRDSSESILVKMPYCWKSHVTAHIYKACYVTTYTLQIVTSGGANIRSQDLKIASVKKKD